MSVMMTYIILFSPDSVQLENKKLIEKIQVKERKQLRIQIPEILENYLMTSFSVQLSEAAGGLYPRKPSPRRGAPVPG